MRKHYHIQIMPIYKQIKHQPEFEMLRTFFVNYRSLLHSKGYNIQKFCRIHGVSRSYIYAMISGHYDRPVTVYRLAWFANLLDVSPFDLFVKLREDGTSIYSIDKGVDKNNDKS